MFIFKALKWFGKAYLQTALFCAIVAGSVVALMTFIAYPVQTITALLIGFIVVAAFAVAFG